MFGDPSPDRSRRKQRFVNILMKLIGLAELYHRVNPGMDCC
jgi:hypothetical protein